MEPFITTIDYQSTHKGAENVAAAAPAHASQTSSAGGTDPSTDLLHGGACSGEVQRWVHAVPMKGRGWTQAGFGQRGQEVK